LKIFEYLLEGGIVKLIGDFLRVRVPVLVCVSLDYTVIFIEAINEVEIEREIQ